MTCGFAAAAVCDEMSEKVVSYRWTSDETVHKVMTQDDGAAGFCEKRVFVVEIEENHLKVTRE